jgi:putative PEP-CTERM system TPR-repeat lipoprotein
MMKQICKGCSGILFVLLALSLTGCGDLFLDEQQTLQKAHEYLAGQKITAAAIELRNTLKANPDNAEARYLLAGINLDFGDYATAQKEFGRAERAGWDIQQTRIGLARCLLGMGRFQDLLAVEINDQWSAGTRAELLGLHAVAEAGLGSMDRAAELAAQAMLLDPGSLQAMKARAQLAIIGGRLEEARTMLSAALQSHPDNPELMLLEAGVLLQSDETAAAREIYQRVIDQDPPGFMSVYGRNARLQLVQLQIAAHELKQAEANIGPLYRRDPNEPFTNYLGGLLAFEQARYQLAEERLLKVLKLAPEHNPTRLLYGVVNFAEQNYEQAAYFLGKYVAAVPDNLMARKVLARSYMLLGRAEEARAVLQTALDDDSGDAELLALAALSELRRGERVAGIAGLESALRASPDNFAIRKELARAYIEAGDTGLAIDELKSMLAEGGEQQQTETLLVLAHLRAGEFPQAISRVLDMLSGRPDDVAVQALAGNVFAASGDLVEARKYLVRALQLESGLPAATLTLAHIEELEGNYTAAASLYQQLVDRKLESALPMLALARVAEQQGDRVAMLDWLERAHQHAPNDIKPRMFLAEYYLRNAAPDKARTLIDEALQIASREPALLAMKGRVLMAQHKYRKALQSLNELIAMEPDSVTGRILLGEVYLRLGEQDNARRELKVALDKDPASVPALVLMARMEINSGAPVQALQYSKRIQQAHPELFLGYELAGDVFMNGKDYAEAAAQYALAWERMNSAGIVIKRAENASRSGNPAAATGYLQDWLIGHPDDVQVMQFLATTWQNMGETVLATRQYEQVLEADPNNQVALNNLAGLYPPAERIKALKLAERAWRVAPDNPGVQDTYGWLLVQEGQLERGTPMLEKAMKSLGTVPEVRYHHAVAVIRSGDSKRGRQLLEALLAEGTPFDGRTEAQRLLNSNNPGKAERN